MNGLLWMLFLSGSVGLIFVSRNSLLHIRSHGFYRFFAWEILLGMSLLNLETWFRQPLIWHQLVSWVLLFLSIPLVLESLRLLRENGKPNSGRQDVSLLKLEKTSRLVTIGLYRHIRHPLYCSLLCLDWGLFFKTPSLLEAGLALACSLFLTATARIEECENINFFGQEYVEYMKNSKMFIPFIF